MATLPLARYTAEVGTEVCVREILGAGPALSVIGEPVHILSQLAYRPGRSVAGLALAAPIRIDKKYSLFTAERILYSGNGPF